MAKNRLIQIARFILCALFTFCIFLDVFDFYGRGNAENIAAKFSCTIWPFVKVMASLSSNYSDFVNSQCLVGAQEHAVSIVYFMAKSFAGILAAVILFFAACLLCSSELAHISKENLSKQRKIGRGKRMMQVFLLIFLICYFWFAQAFIYKSPDHYQTDIINKLWEDLLVLALFVCLTGVLMEIFTFGFWIFGNKIDEHAIKPNQPKQGRKK